MNLFQRVKRYRQHQNEGPISIKTRVESLEKKVGYVNLNFGEGTQPSYLKKIRLHKGTNEAKEIETYFNKGYFIDLEAEYIMDSAFVWSGIFLGIVADKYVGQLVITDNKSLEKIKYYDITFYFNDPHFEKDLPEAIFSPAVIYRQSNEQFHSQNL